nr:MAG TPA: hypothetical protein [Caudoviricetes sp.]
MIVKNINRANGKETEIDFEDIKLKDNENISFVIIDKTINRKINLSQLVYFHKNALTLYIPNQIKIPQGNYTYKISEGSKVLVSGEFKVK